MVENLMILHQGSLLFSGKPCDLGPYMKNQNLPVPDTHHPAEWIIDAAQEQPGLFSKLVIGEDGRK